MSQENVEVVRRIYEAFARGDVATLVSATDAEIRCYDRSGHPGATVFHGHDGLLQLIEDDRQAFEEIRWEPREFTEAGNHVVVPIRQSGRGKASGIPVQDDVVMVWTVCGGKVLELHIYATQREALEAVGLSE
jgi:uncharacterized protein